MFKNYFILLLIFFISACSSIPSNTSNSCSIFNERYLWYKHTKKSEQKKIINSKKLVLNILKFSKKKVNYYCYHYSS